MMKNLLLAATMAAMLASCSNDDLSLQTARQNAAEGVDDAVSFEAYSQRSLTRAGYDGGVLDKNMLKEQGFGVFAYNTELDEYDQTVTPNFMYNQKVTGNGSRWTYAPIKYWLNEYGSNAQSGDVNKLSFFAYAPFVKVNASTGKVVGEGADKEGITGFTSNTAAGDPYVKYIASLDPSKCVDLCWGVVDPSANDGVSWDVIQGGSQTMAAGMPWLNVQRPQKSLGQKMKFVFKHALAQLNVQIDADVNTNVHGHGDELDADTKVFVRSITFSGFAMKGALNLNNEEPGVPNWEGYYCNNEPLQTGALTIYDGMRDGKEGMSYVASNEKVTGLNATIIQSKKWADQAAADGVQKTAKNLFNSDDEDAPIYVIPTGEAMTVSIVYDIETKVDNLAGTVSDNETSGVSIENKISKTITIFGSEALKLKAGQKYTINLHLGLSQVGFDATVDEWQNADSAEGEAWLPDNGAGDVYTTSISLDQISLNKTVGDADVTLNATVTPANATDPVTWTSSNTAVATVDENGKVSFVGAGDAVITAASGGKTVDCTVHVVARFSTLSELKDNVATADDSYLGWYVDGSGNISETDGGSSVGRIAYYGTDDIETAAGTQNILVIATANAASSTVAWKTAGGAGESAYNRTDLMNGKAFTDVYGGNAGYPAAYAAAHYSATAPSGSTGWFLPSYAQWQKMNAAIIAKGLIPAGNYWNSTEYAPSDNVAWFYLFSGSSSGVGHGSKNGSRGVRAVIAF